MNIIEDIERSFHALYCEFISMVERDNFNNCILSGINDSPVVDFGFYTTINIERLTKLPSYIEFKQIVNKHLNKEPLPYNIFSNMFTEMYRGLNPISQDFRFTNKLPSLIDFNGNGHILVSSIERGEPNLDKPIEKSFLIVLQGIKVEERIEIPDVGYIDSLGKDIEKLKNNRMYNFKLGHVYTGLYLKDDKYLNDDYIKVLLTIFRLFKTGDVRYVNKYKEVLNYATGGKFEKYSMVSSQSDYTEESVKHRGDALSIYEIRKCEIQEFISFYVSVYAPLQKLKHSCEYFNRAVLSPHYIKELFLFIVIESFFSDVKSEISYRISMYITNIMDEDENFYLMFKELYNLRSKIAHGDMSEANKCRTKIYKKYPQKIQRYSSDGGNLIEGIVKSIFKRLAEIDWNPKNSDQVMRKRLIS